MKIPSHRHVSVLGGLAAMALALMAAGDGWAAGRGVTDTKIKLGIVMDKTGPTAALGESTAHGMIDYFNYLNDRGGINGRKVEVIWEDDQFEAPKSVAAVKKLLTRDEVLTILTTGGTNGTIANLQNIKQYKITNIPNSLASEFFRPVNPYIFAMGASYEVQYGCIVDYIATDLKLNSPKIGVLYAKKEYGMIGLEAIKKTAAKYNIPVVAEMVVSPGAPDTSSQVLAFQKEGANVVITCDVMPTVVSFLKTAHKYNYSPVVFGFNYATDDALVRACGEAAKNYIGVNFVGGWWSDQPGVKLAREVATKNGRKPGMTSLYLNGFGVSWLFGEAMKRAGKDLNPDTLAKAMESLSGYETGGILPAVDYSASSHEPPQMVQFFKADVPGNRLVPVTGWRKFKEQ